MFTYYEDYDPIEVAAQEWADARDDEEREKRALKLRIAKLEKRLAEVERRLRVLELALEVRAYNDDPLEILQRDMYE